MRAKLRTNHQGIFITGTDTGVGKTYIACGLAAELRKQGIDVGVMKPAETGCRARKGVLLPADAVALARAAGVDDPLDLINPFRFRIPAAPAVSARQEGKRIDLSRIAGAFRKLADLHEFLIVEGAGGIMVPLTSQKTFLDLAEMTGLPVLIVARPNLGTINHALLTIQALRERSLPLAGICVNDSRGGPWGIVERTSPDVIAKMSSARVLARVRHGQKSLKQLTDALRRA